MENQYFFEVIAFLNCAAQFFGKFAVVAVRDYHALSLSISAAGFNSVRKLFNNLFLPAGVRIFPVPSPI